MKTISSASFALFAACLLTPPLAGCAAESTGEPVEGASESDLSATTSFTGTFLHMAAIGGETTGTWLSRDDNGGFVELDLSTHHLDSEFVAQKHVKVTGKFKTIHGVEIKTRKVLVVSAVAPLGGGQVTTPGASILTNEATQIVVENHGGGFTAPPPAGSQCAVGAAKFTLDLGTKHLSWKVCDMNDRTKPFVQVTGSRTLTSAQFNSLSTHLAAIKVTHGQTCGADKPFETATVTTATDSFEYIDAFYGCMDQAKSHVDDIDAALTALRALMS